MHPDEYQSLMDEVEKPKTVLVAIGRKHCYHDSGRSMFRGDSHEGSSVCCWCGFKRSWHTRKEVIPGHGRYHTPTQQVRVWEGEEPTCEEYEKQHGIRT